MAIEHTEAIPAKCERCEQLAAEIQAEHERHLIVVGSMQDTIDELRREKNEALCRCQGWDTKGMSE
jgi:hypothetical protein